MMAVTSGPQKPPWQRPMPGRTRRLTPSTVSQGTGLRSASNISPLLTSSHRQTISP